MASDSPLLTTYVFVVAIPGFDTIGHFSYCHGLELGVDVYEYREGGNNETVYRLPGPLNYPNLLLTRGLTNEQALLQWFLSTQAQTERKEVTLTLKGGDVDRTWTFADAFPIKWTGPQL